MLNNTVKVMRWIKTVALSVTMLFPAFHLLQAQDQLRILPLGNSITRGSMCLNGNVNNCDRLPDQEAIGYRHRLYNLMNGAGFNVDFIGNLKFGYSIMTDPDNAGFSGIRDNYLADIMETGTSAYTGQVTAGPYLNSYPADVILLHIGTNDVSALDYSVNDVARILDAIDDYENASGEPILVFLAEIISRRDNPCGTDPGVTTFNSRLVSMAQSRISSGDLIALVDMECGAGINYYNDLVDQVHPNQTGYDKMADKWFQAIDSYNTRPQVTQIPDQVRDRGSSFSTISLDSYVYDAEDSDSEITWTWYPSSPQHFNISIDGSRRVTVTPRDPNWSGTETIEFVATDNGAVIPALKKSASCLTDFTVNWTPEIIGQKPISTPENTPLLIETEDLIIVEPEKAPSGMVVEVSGGDHYTVQGQTVIPEQNFSGTLSVPVRLVAGADESNLYTLSVEVSNVNHAPVITSSPVLSAKSGLEYVYEMAATDEDPGDVLVYSAMQKPSWMQVNSTTGRVSGTPSLNDLGFVNVTLKVSDGAEEDTQSYTLEVQNYNLPPEIITDPRDTALVAQTYTYGIQATDVEGDPLTYFAQTLPEWLNFYAETQVLIGVPGHDHAGENLVVLGVTDQKDTTFQAFVLLVTFTAGTDDPQANGKIRIYPNPATEFVIIETDPGTGAAGLLHLEILDLTGKVVMTEELVRGHNEVALTGRGIYNGMYFFRITDPVMKEVVRSGKILIKAGDE